MTQDILMEFYYNSVSDAMSPSGGKSSGVTWTAFSSRLTSAANCAAFVSATLFCSAFRAFSAAFAEMDGGKIDSGIVIFQHAFHRLYLSGQVGDVALHFQCFFDGACFLEQFVIALQRLFFGFKAELHVVVLLCNVVGGDFRICHLIGLFGKRNEIVELFGFDFQLGVDVDIIVVSVAVGGFADADFSAAVFFRKGEQRFVALLRVL